MAKTDSRPDPPSDQVIRSVATIPSAALWPIPTVLPDTYFPPIRYSLHDDLGNQEQSKSLHLSFGILVRGAAQLRQRQVRVLIREMRTLIGRIG